MPLVFTPHKIGDLEIKNCFVHSATYEFMATATVEVTDELIKSLTDGPVIAITDSISTFEMTIFLQILCKYR